MNKNQVIIALVVLCLLGTIWGATQSKKSSSLERQLVAMRKAPAAPVMDEVAASDTSSAVADIDELTAQNTKLLKDAASLKGSVASQKNEIANLTKELAESGGGSQAVTAVQTQLDERTAEVAGLKEAAAATNAKLTEFDEMKATLANSVDSYSAKSQALAAEVEEYAAQIQILEEGLNERTKLLVGAGEELARTKLNMNVLLSKIAAQNNSLEILEETRVALEKELAVQFQIIEELERQLSAQVVIEAVVVEEVLVIEAPAVEEAPAN